MDYKQLSLAERYYIQLERKLGKSYAEIACNLGRAPSTISRSRAGGRQRGRQSEATWSFFISLSVARIGR